MNKFSSIFGQILQVFSWSEFYKAVMETESEKGAKGFTCWQQFVVVLFCLGGGPFLKRDMRRACKLSWEGKTPWH